MGSEKMMPHNQFDGNYEPNISHKVIFTWRKIIFSTIFAVILLAWCFGFTNKLIEYYNLSIEQIRLQEEEKKYLEYIETLKKEKQNLNEDWYIEKMAREKLNLTKPGEVLIKVVPAENP
jgi:cell division protein FtsB